jgi:hypothetical protein
MCAKVAVYIGPLVRALISKRSLGSCLYTTTVVLVISHIPLCFPHSTHRFPVYSQFQVIHGALSLFSSNLAHLYLSVILCSPCLHSFLLQISTLPPAHGVLGHHEACYISLIFSVCRSLTINTYILRDADYSSTVQPLERIDQVSLLRSAVPLTSGVWLKHINASGTNAY